MPTLQDIADRVGVSTVTVSKVLRGKVKGSWPSSAARAERVREVARELGYQVDWRARALKTKRTHMIGILSTEKPETRAFGGPVLSALVDTLGEAGYQLTFVRVDRDSKARDFADARFDGLIIDYHVESEELEIIKQSDIPTVIINAPTPVPDHAVSVMPDHIAAGRLAAEYLMELGHERIGLVEASESEQGRWPDHMMGMWRAGLAAAMEDAGKGDGFSVLAPDPGPDRQETFDDYVTLLSDRLSKADRPTALVANNPVRGVECVLKPLEKLGVRCPDDISLLTMEDLETLSWCQPAVSAVEIPFGRLGELAGQQILSMIGPADVDSVDNDADIYVAANRAAELRGRIIERDSAGPPPSRNAGSKKT